MYKNLRALRESLHMTQTDFASSLGIAKTTYYGYETGVREPRSDFWVAVARKYGVTIDYLMGYSNDPHRTSTDAKQATPELSDEAVKVAKDYDKLTDHGKGAVRAILGYEGKALSHYSQQEDEGGKAVTMPTSKRNSHGFIEIKVYNQPAAAGLGNYLDEPDYRVEQYPPKVIPSKTDFGVIISGDSMEPKIHDGGTVFVRAMPAIDPGQIGIFVLDGKAFCKKLMVDQINRQIHLVSLNPQYEDIIVDEDTDTFRTLGRVLGQWTPGYKQDLLEW